jgi:O-antigen ligase
MLSAAQRDRLAAWAAFIERHDLLAKFYLLTLSLIFILPNVGPVRNMYYIVIVPMLFIVMTRAEALRIVRSPIFIFMALYFLVYALAAPFAVEFSARDFIGHIRNSVLVLTFLAITVRLMLRNPQFPLELFLVVGVIGALVGLNNLWQFYGGLPPLDRMPRRFEGIEGITMYYNPNWIAQMYGVVCVGAAAAATRPGTRAGVVAALALSALVLFGCVLLTQTRSVLIGTVLGLGAVLVLLPGQTRVKRTVQFTLIAAAAVASVPFVEALIARGDPYRVAFWQAYIPLVETYPWIGHGLTAPIIVHAPDGAETNHPHNIVYHALLRGGVFALTALLALFAAVCWQALRAWRITGSALYPALIIVALIPLQLEFTVVVGTSVGWDWLVLWMPIGLAMGAAMLDPGDPASRFAG